MIGIDGGSFNLISPLIKQGLLPNFRKIMNDGFFSELKVTVPPVTIPSWPCIFSGMTPYQLGYYWFIHPKESLFNSYVWREKAIFNSTQIRSFVLNIPGTYPPWKINGELLSGMLSPEFASFPKDLEFSLKENWIIDSNEMEGIIKAFQMKKDLFLKKLEEDFNLLAYVIRMPDCISHNPDLGIKETIDKIMEAYKKIDKFIGEILKYEFDNLLIVSDHGLKEYKREFNLYRWLKMEKILSINEYQPNPLKYLGLKLFDFIRPVFDEINIKIFDKLLDLSFKKKEKKSKLTIVDAKSTAIQDFMSNVGGLYLNKEDKQKVDIIKSSLEKSKYIKEIIKPECEYFPDFFIILQDDYVFAEKPSLFITRKRSTILHSQHGIFLAYGKNIKKGYSKQVCFHDIVPTLLKLFNLPLKSWMIGKPLSIK